MRRNWKTFIATTLCAMAHTGQGLRIGRAGLSVMTMLRIGLAGMLLAAKRSSKMLVAGLALVALIQRTHVAHHEPAALAPHGLGAYAELPLSFEPCSVNCGGGGTSDFLAHGRGYSLFLSQGGAVLASPARKDTISLKLVGARTGLQGRPEDELPGKSNYFIGSDPRKWRTYVPNYARVHYKGVYPGIDLVYYGNQGQLEFDFIVAPGADPCAIEFELTGVERAALDAGGDLAIPGDAGGIRLHKPLLYQQVDDKRLEVAGGYSVAGERRFRLAVSSYDRDKPLVIDPVLSYSTYFGGGGTLPHGIAVDSAGNAYLIGATGEAYRPLPDVSDVFVAKLNPAGSALVYSTHLGGIRDDYGLGIAVDAAGSAYITGRTNSADFPTVNPPQAELRGSFDAFVAKVDATGSLVYSTFLGGSGSDVGIAIAVDAAGSTYVTGDTRSVDLPTVSPLQGELHGMQNVFIAKLKPAGSGVLYATYLGGTREDFVSGIVVDPAGSAYVTGFTDSVDFPTRNPLQTLPRGGFVAKLNPAGSALVYSTYIHSQGRGIAADDSGHAYVAGGDVNGPFVAKVNPAGAEFVYMAHFGSRCFDGMDYSSGASIAVDTAGNAYVTGYACSDGVPLMNALQTSQYEGAFVARLNPAGSLVFSTVLGGSGGESGTAIAIDSAGSVYVIGLTWSTDFPVLGALQPVFRGDPRSGPSGFVLKISDQPAPAPDLAANSLLNAASLQATTVLGTTFAPGTIVSLFGKNLAAAIQPASRVPLPNTLMDTTVLFNDIPAPLFFVSPTQINAQVPFELATGTATVEVRRTNGRSVGRAVTIGESSPGIFTVNQQGNGPGVIVHADTFRLVTETSPAGPDEFLSIFCTGLGRLQQPIASGRIPPIPPPETVIRPQVTVGGLAASVSYSGVAPGFVGLYQVNVRAPASVAKGSAVPVVLSTGGIASNIVTVAVQ